MKILHLIESMGQGGAERHLANLFKPLSALGVENHLVTLWPGHAYEDQIAGFVSQRKEFNLNDRKVFPALPGLLPLVRQVDLVHTQLPWADIIGRMAARIEKKPVVTTLQTTWYDEENVKKWGFKLRQKVRALRFLDVVTSPITQHFFAVSQATKDTYIKVLHASPERFEVLFNTVQLSSFSPEVLGDRQVIREGLGLASHEVALTIVARLVPPKRHEDAIRAVAEACKSAPVKLFFAGVGPEEARLRDLAATLRCPVTFLGLRNDVGRVLYASDIFLFPSLFEGLPLALIEAMAMGLAAICSDIPENREVCGDAALYNPVMDVSGLTQKILLLAQDPARRLALSPLARQRAQRFSAEPAAQRFFNAAQEVLHSWRR
jgi:glycosyltransferase involved in cell wall biosynthesis